MRGDPGRLEWSSFRMDHISASLAFILIDCALALAGLGFVVVAYWRGRVRRADFLLMWIGAFIGLTWELPICWHIAYGEEPLARFLAEPQPHWLVVGLLHSIWDGLLCFIGLLLVRRLLAAPHFAGFRWSELGVLLLWGQFQSLLIECASLFFEGWQWIPRWWNPELFIVNAHSFTALPQLLWIYAIALFYPVALWMHRR